MKKKEGYFVFLYCIDKKFLFLNGSVLKDYYVLEDWKLIMIYFLFNLVYLFIILIFKSN